MNVCRVCLSTKADKVISELEVECIEKEGIKTPSEIMQFCLSIEVTEDSKITNKLCSTCFEKISTFHSFKALALRNDACLKSLFHDLCIKIEPVALTPGDSVPTVDEDQDFLNDVKLESDTFESEDEFLVTFQSFSSVEPSLEPEEPRLDTESEQIKIEIGPLKAEEDETGLEVMTEEKSVKTNVKSKATVKSRKRKRKIPKAKSEICEQCGKTVKNVKEHALIHLPKHMKRKFPCKDADCNRLFNSICTRNKHYNIKHLGIKQHCDICNKDITCLATHIIHVHEPERMPHPCVLCDRRFISQSSLDKHITIHTKDQPHACEHCGKTFRLIVSMRKHVRSVHQKEKSYICHHCSRSFFQKDHLTRHIRSHTKEKPYECNECGRSFTCSNILKTHIQTHSTTKDFHCTECSMSFVCARYLSNHMISHTKIKKHPCKYCGVKFGRSDHRKRHEFTAHEKKMLAGRNGGKEGDENNMAADQIHAKNVIKDD